VFSVPSVVKRITAMEFAITAGLGWKIPG